MFQDTVRENTVFKAGRCLNIQQICQIHLEKNSIVTSVFFIYRRPTSDMNIASGCPLFCQLSTIDQTVPAYLKDDTMFIKVIVDLADSQKSLIGLS